MRFQTVSKHEPSTYIVWIADLVSANVTALIDLYTCRSLGLTSSNGFVTTDHRPTRRT